MTLFVTTYLLAMKGHRELERRVAIDRGFVFEVAHPARRQHHALEREILGEGEGWKREKAQKGQTGQKMSHKASPAMHAHREGGL